MFRGPRYPAMNGNRQQSPKRIDFKTFVHLVVQS
jgi:hypothetical protein